MAAPTKEKIVEQYNLSIDALQNAHKASETKNFNGVLNELALSGGYIYQALEWFLKNYLYSIFPDASVHSSQHTTIEAPSFPNKLSLFETNAHPALSTTGIDISTVKELKAAVRNNTEHSGVTPHYNSLIIVLDTTKKLLEKYLAIPSVRLKNPPENQNIEIETSESWLELFSAAEKFTNAYNYLLITDLSKEKQTTIKPLSLIDWNAVIDFDPNSETTGFHAATSAELSLRRSIHRYTLNDTLPSNFSEDSCYWIYANGLTGRANTIFIKYPYWNSKYMPFLTRVFAKLHSAISAKPTIVIILTEDSSYAIDVAKLIFNSFTDSAKFVFATTDLNLYLTFANQYEGIQIKISVPQITTGLLTIRRYFNPMINQNEISIPHKDSGFTNLSQVKYKWLKEDLEVLHRYLVDELNEADERIDFYKGGKIGWKGLMLGYDLPRDYVRVLDSKVEKSLRDRIPKMVSFFHYPGIGGSSISKRVAWRFKDKYPVVWMKVYRANETINRIYELFQLSALPPLVLMDSEFISAESRKRIVDESLIRSFPVTFLEIQRKGGQPLQLSADQIYLTEVLSDDEVFTFAKAYGELVLNKKTTLDAIIKSNSIKEKHPLFFGLTAFEENFRGLQEFVMKALQSGTSDQKKIVAFICLAGIYAQKSLSAQTFTGILAFPESQSVKLEDHLSESMLHLITNDGGSLWRPLHYLIGKQILKDLYGGTDELMRIGISDLSVEFIELVGNKASTPTTAEYEVLDRLFIERFDEEDEDDDERQFSKLIREGLYDENARLRIFNKLTDVFPEKVHYWSHLARFYNLVVKDQNKALNAIDMALELDSLETKSKDSTLYHIKGMILKSQAAALMQKNWHKLSIDPAELAEIKSLITQSNEQFEDARILNIHSDYGYITDIDAITHYLDFKYKKSNLDDRSKFLIDLDDFDLKLFTKARLLLEEVRSKLHHNSDDFYYNRARNKLQEYFNNYSSIIQTWQNLLSSTNNLDKAAIRQNLAHAYVGRANGWENLDKDLEKVLKLLTENITLDPSNGRNIFLWLKAARYSGTLRVSDVVPKLVLWRTAEQSIEASFYLGILYVIEAINGNSLASKQASNLIREVSEKARFYPYRAHASEWYGKGSEMTQIKSRNFVVSRNDGSKELIFDMTKLKQVSGKIASIKGPESGEIEFASGLTASFIPARADSGRGFVKGRDENKDVRFILGFSYDGLKAFDVIASPVD